MTRDDVVDSAIKWLKLMKDAIKIAEMGITLDQPATDILSAAIQLARESAEQNLKIYMTEKMEIQKQHEQVLETIEELLQENIKDIKNDRSVER